MKRKSRPSTARLIRKRDALMKRLADAGPVLRGSLVTAQRGNHTAHQLTVSVRGKTRTVYVPVGMVAEVKQWTKNYRQMHRLLEEISKLNMAIIHCHVPEGRGDARRSATSKQSR